jgi:hypothetical protein
LSEKGTAYMNARSVYKELKKRMEKVQRLHMASRTVESPMDQQQLDAWIQLISWEQTENPLHLDPEPLYQRVLMLYRMAISSIQCSSRLWMDSFFFVQKSLSSGSESATNATAIDLLKQGLKALPTDQMIGFTLADNYEHNKEIDLAKNVYEELLSANSNTSEQSGDSEPSAELDPMTEQRITLIWIQYMRFARRTEGITSARQIFSRARKMPYCTWHLFVAAGWIEYFVAKEPVIAFKIFELGMKKYASEILFIKEYLKILLWHMDDANARALFERALQAIPDPDQQKPLWDMMMQYEKDFGFHLGLQQLSERRLMVPFSPPEKPWDMIIQKTSFLDLTPDGSIPINTGFRVMDHLSTLNWLVQHLDSLTKSSKQSKVSPILPVWTPPSIVELVSRTLALNISQDLPILPIDDMIHLLSGFSISAMQEALKLGRSSSSAPTTRSPPPPPTASGGSGYPASNAPVPSFLRSIQDTSDNFRKKPRPDYTGSRQ